MLIQKSKDLQADCVTKKILKNYKLFTRDVGFEPWTGIGLLIGPQLLLGRLIPKFWLTKKLFWYCIGG